MKQASYAKYKPNICRRSGQLPPSRQPGWQPWNRCRAPALAGTTPPWAEPTLQSGQHSHGGLGPKAVWLDRVGRCRGDGERQAFKRALHGAPAPRGGPGIRRETPLSQCFPTLQLLETLARKRPSSSKSGNSWIFQCLYFQSAAICRTSNCAPGTRTRACHVKFL